MKITVKSSEFPIKINLTQIPVGVSKLDIILDSSDVQNILNQTNVDVEVDTIEESDENNNIQVHIEKLRTEQTRKNRSIGG